MQPTLIEFLEKTHSKVHVFDMGRRIQKIPRQSFLEFEQAKISYPFPLQRHAWFGVCIASLKTADEPVIWFLKLPLDEQGKLVQASRDYFLHRLLEAITEDLSSPEQLSNTDVFKDNPYVFKPREERMAVFHSRLSATMKKSYSRFYDHAIEYFSGIQGWDQWNFVGYQGIADVAIASSGNTEISNTIANAISHLPAQPLIALSQCLENTTVLPVITQKLIQRINLELEVEDIDINLISSLLRGVSLSQQQTEVENVYEMILKSSIANDIEILAAISGRSWQTLNNFKIAQAYLEALAINDAGEQGFNECLRDLFSLPDMRNPLLEVLTNQASSQVLRDSFQTFTASLVK